MAHHASVIHRGAPLGDFLGYPVNDDFPLMGLRSSVAPPFAIALLVGVLAAIITSKIPALGLPLAVGTPIALAVRTRLVRRETSRQLAEISGVLLGSGGIFLFGALNTVAACEGTDDFCGNANVVPLFALALGMIVLGILSSAGAVRDHGVRS